MQCRRKQTNAERRVLQKGDVGEKSTANPGIGGTFMIVSQPISATVQACFDRVSMATARSHRGLITRSVQPDGSQLRRPRPREVVMRSATFALAVLFGVFAGASARADLALTFSDIPQELMEFQGTGSGANFSFNANGSGQGFSITSSTGVGDSVGLYGSIGGTFSYTTPSSGSTASATGSGTLTIIDGNGVKLTGTVVMEDVSTFGTFGGTNINGQVNLTGVSYSGSNQDLTQLKNEADTGGGAVLTISFQFTTPESLKQLANTKSISTSYSGSIATTAGGDVSGVPEPSGLAIAGIGALGLIGYSLRRKRCGTRRA